MIEIICAASWLAGRRFYSFSHELYRDVPEWREPDVWQGRKALSPRHNELLRGSHALLMAKESGEVLARVLVGTDGRRGYFAMLDMLPCEEAVARLMDAAAEWQRQRGIATLIGPIAPTPTDLGGGILCEGFEELAAFGDSYNASYYSEYLEKCGFETCSEWLAYRVSAERFDRRKYRAVAEWTTHRFGFSVRNDLTKQPRHLVEMMRTVMEVDEEDRMERAMGRLIPYLKEGMCPVVFAADRPVGFILTICKKDGRPRIVTLWVAAEWRRKGVTAVLFNEIAEEACRRGITEMDASLVRADNVASRIGIEAAGGRVIHRYRQYEKHI